MGRLIGRENRCTTLSGTEAEQWNDLIGTEVIGNLPQYKKDQHVGHCYAPCPYSTQSSELRTRLLLGLSESDPLPTKVDHSSNNTVYYMKTQSRGPRWGFECTYPGCPYLTNTNNKYFYV